MVEAFIALGSNIGDREGNIRNAFQFLEAQLTVLKASSIYETKPMYLENQDWFLNCAAKVETDLSPQQLLKFLKNIEKEFGRKVVERNGPRIIDLDIVFYGNQVVDEPDLQIPHPRIQERAFVLVPLAEIAPQFVHSTCGKTIAQLLSELDYDKSEIKKVATYGTRGEP
ncbi:MAG: 2-amino-4-hydroxy-6-hydroxymethyldihydropteridine diphosphokinase [Candidatus Bathyarchaeota archaeon]|nr:2-amino-4-hydroxy-6-hydroxymethyldihydropteridine diphosphokinase [Candidatus Bathyarchaeota archaeon]